MVLKELLKKRFKHILDNDIQDEQNEAFVVGCLMGIIHEILMNQEEVKNGNC